MKVKYPKLSLTEQVTKGIRMTMARPSKGFDGPFIYKPGSELPHATAMQCDGRYLLALGMRERSSSIWANGAVLLTIAGIIMAMIIKGGFIDGDHVSWRWWLALSIFGFLGIFLLIRSYFISDTQFFVFDRETGNVLFPPRKGKHLVVPFSMVECVGYFHTRGYGGGLYQSYINAKKVPKGVDAWAEQIAFLDMRNRAGAEREWNMVCQFMDKSMPIPPVLEVMVRDYQYSGMNVAMQIIDQEQHNRAVEEQQQRAVNT